MFLCTSYWFRFRNLIANENYSKQFHTVQNTSSSFSGFIYRLYSTVFNYLRCTGNSLRCTFNTSGCTLNTSGCTRNSLRCTLNTSRCTRNSLRCTLNTFRCTRNSSRCTLNDSRCTRNSSRCTLNDSRCTNNNSRCTLNSSWCTDCTLLSLSIYRKVFIFICNIAICPLNYIHELPGVTTGSTVYLKRGVLSLLSPCIAAGSGF